MNVGVLGAGVSGLTAAIVLQEKGYNVIVMAKDVHPNITSSTAGAYWSPHAYAKAEVTQRAEVVRWCDISRRYFEELVRDSRAGCRMRTILRVEDTEGPDPWWSEHVPTFRRVTHTRLPHGYGSGYEFDGVVMDTSVYMPYLMDRFSAAGGTIQQRNVIDIAGPQGYYDVLINCTALGSRSLFNDATVYPTRGQMIRVQQNGFDHVIGDSLGRNNLAYIVPRTSDIVLGGTFQEHVDDTHPRQEDTEEILRKCRELSSAFDHVNVLDVSVGLRPSRSRVRVELELVNSAPIVHNYGHGGAGFMMSWGCAEDIADIVGGLRY